MCGLGYMDRGGGEGGRLKTRASEINRKVAKFRRVATFGIF